MNPFAPITPDQEAAIRTLATKLSRDGRDRIERGLLQLSAGEADELLRRLRGEPAPPVEPAPVVDRATVRAANAALRDKLDSAFAGRAMQPVGLSRPSLFAGFNGSSIATTR